MFMFACSLAFMLACTFAFAGLVAGRGEAVVIVFALALVFEFSVVVQAPPITAKAINVKKPVVLRIAIPPVSKTR